MADIPERTHGVRSRLLFLPEVAERARIPEATLRYYRFRGLGPKSARLGRRIVYREADVDAWIEERFSNDGTPAA